MKKHYIILLLSFALLLLGNKTYTQNGREERKTVAPSSKAVTSEDNENYYGDEEEDVVVTSKNKNNSYAKKAFELRLFDTAKIGAWKRDPRFKYEEEKMKWESTNSSSASTYGNRTRPYEYNPPATEGSRSGEGTTGSNRPPPPNTDPNKKGSAGTSESKPPPPPPPPTSNVSMDLSWLLWVLAAIAIATIGYVIYTQMKKPKYNKNYSGQKITDDKHDDIHNIRYPTELEKAIADKNYRLAIKLMYLEQLKMLDDKKMINWRLNKTNWDYLAEIKDPIIANNYKASSFIFDSAWYGELPLTDQSFKQVYEVFTAYKQQLS